MDLKQLFKKKGFRLFLFLITLFFIAGAFVIVLTKRGDVLLLINKYSKEEWDPVVERITNIGLGSHMVIVSLLLLFYKVRYALTGLLNLVFIGVFTNVLKEMFKEVFTRPFHYFLYDDLPRFIYTADLNYYSTFPSGHSMTIFGMLAFLAFIFNKRVLSVFLFIMAVLVGFSRIYLLQHFFVDVYAGASLGIFSLMITLWITENRLTFMNKGMFDRSIQRNLQLLFRKKGKKFIF